MRYEKTIVISKEKAEQINRHLHIEPTCANECLGEDIAIVNTATFENGYEMDIKCCGVQYNEEDESNTAWTEAVLFCNGSEVCCSEPSDEYLGEWILETDEDEYVVVVKVEEEKITKTEYIVKAFEEECGTDFYKVTVPSCVSNAEVMEAFMNAEKYVKNSGYFSDKIGYECEIGYEEMEDMQENDVAEYVRLGKQVFDEHFEQMLDIEIAHRLEIFQYYIRDCKGWKIEPLIYDFEFEW